MRVLTKICTNLSKQSIHLISFAIPALIYSLGLPIMAEITPKEFFRIWLTVLFLGLLASIPFYATLWYFLGIFQRVFPNRSNKLTQLISIHFISFATTALIFSLMLAFFTRFGYDDAYKIGHIGAKQTLMSASNKSSHDLSVKRRGGKNNPAQDRTVF